MIKNCCDRPGNCESCRFNQTEPTCDLDDVELINYFRERDDLQYYCDGSDEELDDDDWCLDNCNLYKMREDYINA